MLTGQQHGGGGTSSWFNAVTHRHQRLSDTGQYGRSERVHQDLVFGDGKHQQGDGVLWAQVLEQRGKSATAANIF